MEKNLHIDIDARDIIEGIRPDAPPPLESAKPRNEEKPEPVRQGEKPAGRERQPKRQGKVKTDDYTSEEEEYLSRFINTPPLANAVRRGKLVYVTQETHECIQRIVNVIGNNRVNISTYIENVLAYHLDEFKKPIRSLYDKNYHDVF